MLYTTCMCDKESITPMGAIKSARTSKLDFSRSKTLWEKKVISDAEYESAQSAFDIAEADVEAAKESYTSWNT